MYVLRTVRVNRELFKRKLKLSVTRKEADKVYTLPGLTFDINFENYAGYLKGVPGNYLHYWYVTFYNKINLIKKCLLKHATG